MQTRRSTGAKDGATRENGKILIVDDESFICTMISRWLEPEGYVCAVASDVKEALEILSRETFDLLISDINMPGRTGLDLLATATEQYPDMAVLMATAVGQRETAIRALEAGAYGYMIKPFDKNEFLINVVNALERRRLTMESRAYEQRLEEEVRERTADIRNREEEIATRLVWAAEYRDDETGMHIKRIGLLAAKLAETLGWSLATVDDMRVAAPMHDIGKIGIPDHILQKPGKLTKEEFDIIKTHSEIGAGILGNSDIPLLQLARDIALSHHEKWDGSGYPQGLSGEAIPEAARIVALVDVYDALVNDRVYRPAFPDQEAIQIISMGAGQHFDPRVYEAFMRVLPDFKVIRQEVDSDMAAYP
jgi:putative two-component system response regulator